MQCQYCLNANKKIELPASPAEHLVVTKDKHNHFHIHGPIKNIELMREFIDKIQTEAGLKPQLIKFPVELKPTEPIASDDSPKKLILINHQSPGDIVMLTACVRDLHKAYPGKFLTDVRTPFPDLWKHNKLISKFDDNDLDVTKIRMEYPIIHQSNEGAYHFIHGFHLFLEEKLGLRIPPTKFWGDVPLSDEEKSWISMIHEHFTHEDTPYWIIVSGGKTDYTAKWWIPEYAQAVVDNFKNKIQFVQIGEVKQGHHHPPLRGVIDLRGKTDLRQLIRLIGHADGVICPVTMHMHLAAAIDPYKSGKPKRRACIVTAGGREPSNFTCYTNHQYLHTNGALKCCDNGGCWKSRISPLGDGDNKDNELCTDTIEFNGRQVQRCMHDCVTPIDVIRAIEKYYCAGALKYLEDGKKTIEGTLP